MIGFLILLFHVLISLFKTQARLEAEIVLLRHQLSVLRQRAPSKPRLTVAALIINNLNRSVIRSIALAASIQLFILQPDFYVEHVSSFQIGHQ